MKNMPRKAPPLSASASAETLSPRTRKSLQRDERVGRARLGVDERGQQDDRGAEQPEHLGRAPARRVGADHAVDEREQAAGAEHGAGEVEAAGRRFAAALGDEQRRRRPARGSRPGTLTKKIHSQPSESTSTPPATTPSVPPMPASAPQTPSAMLRSRPAGKVTVSSASAAGESSAAPTPWTARAAISALGRGHEAAGQRGDAEQREAGQEEPAAAEQVARPPAEQQQAAERERVAVDDPLQAVGGEPEVGLDRGQRDVHDRDVEDDHELGDGEHRQREPLAIS